MCMKLPPRSSGARKKKILWIQLNLTQSSTCRDCEVFGINRSIVSGESFPTHTIWLENSEDRTSLLCRSGAEMLVGQACVAPLRVAGHCVYPLHAQLGCPDLPGAPEAKAFRCEAPVPMCAILPEVSPASAGEPHRHSAWDRYRHRVLTDTELPEGKGREGKCCLSFSPHNLIGEIN